MRAMSPFSGFGREPLDYDGDMAVGSTPVDDDLYREIILDHYRNPRHHQAVDPADRVIEANNPLCGDEIDLSYRLDDGTVAAIGFMGRGCSISQASASMLCEAVTGMSVEGAAALAERFRAMLTGDGSAASEVTTSATSRRCAACVRTRCVSSARRSCGTRSSRG